MIFLSILQYKFDISNTILYRWFWFYACFTKTNTSVGLNFFTGIFVAINQYVLLCVTRALSFKTNLHLLRGFWFREKKLAVWSRKTACNTILPFSFKAYHITPVMMAKKLVKRGWVEHNTAFQRLVRCYWFQL